MNYYDILEIESNTDMKLLKKQYYKLSKKYHPDKKTGDKNKFLLLSQAYQTLSNPKKRYIYDIQLLLSIDSDIDCQFSEEELDILYNYYSKIRNSVEFKFLKILYNSLPKSIQINIVSYIRNNSHKEYSLIKRNYKIIDCLSLYNDYHIVLKRKLSDVYNNLCKCILVITKEKVYYLYITHSDYYIYLKNNKFQLEIQIETIHDPIYHINGYDIYMEKIFKLYDYYFHQKQIINLPNNQSIDIDLSLYKHTICKYNQGLHNPLTNKRNHLYITIHIDLHIHSHKLQKYKKLLEDLFT